MRPVRFKRWTSLAKTLPRLGLLNLGRVAVYRLLLATRLHPVCRLTLKPVRGKFFAAPGRQREEKASHYWQDSARYFDYIDAPLSDKPDWHYRPTSGTSTATLFRPWWKVGNFDPQLGDIKEIWDISRFSWVLALAQRASRGETASLTNLNDWLVDWLEHNPLYAGYNWKCGQEASIRVMHLAMAALILGQANAPMLGLRTLVRVHLARIRPTIAYAVAQDNNHGICEAAALFIGGSWLVQTDGDEAAHAWMSKGRRQLEERAARLIADDGGFSMYSVMYHREFLDALSMAEVWRRACRLPVFSTLYQERLSRAAIWLAACVHPKSGHAPNIGANDGTRLLPLTDTDYRDFRPSVQLACVLFCNARAYGETGSWDTPLHWLNIPKPDAVLPTLQSQLYNDSGLALLKSWTEDAQAFVRFPRYRFRPNQSDALHIDFWLGGENLLRDAGTFSYNIEPRWLKYFGGTEGHNTVQFDDRDQMPRLGRFLFGDWLKTQQIETLREEAGNTQISVGYRDGWGASHSRRVELTKGCLNVEDKVAGFAYKAVLRWRLAPGVWAQNGTTVNNGKLSLIVQSDAPIVRCELVEGWESRHYLEKTALPVLEIEIAHAGTLSSELRWST